MAGILLQGVGKTFADGAHAVRDLDLRIEHGELLALLGPSGCGKSTALRLIAGLESLSTGSIHIGDRRVDHLPPDRRDVAMVFQSYALYGHMTVRGNIEFPLRVRGVDRARRRRRAEQIAELLELGDVLDKRPAALSGGQQQRAAMGRALVREPEAFLLDEPLSNLDARLRAQVRAEIGRLQRRLGITTIHVTHDQVEALALGHRIAVLRDGRLQQVGTGRELFDRPANTFVASFLGDPGMNLLAGRLHDAPDGPAVALEGCDTRIALGDSAPSAPRGGPVVVGLRPEDARLEGGAGGGSPGGPVLAGRLRAIEPRGRDAVVHVETECTVLAPPDAPGSGTRALAVRASRDALRAEPGDVVRVRLSAAALRLFDEEGVALGPGGR